MNDTLYIVDDDEGHAELIQSNLIDAGLNAEIRCFSSGYDVLDALYRDDANAELPLCMVLDLNMPGMHGTTVLEKLRSEERTRALPVIVLSTSSDSSEVERCYSLGCNLYLRKPATYEGFVSVIRLLGAVVNTVCLPNRQNWGTSE